MKLTFVAMLILSLAQGVDETPVAEATPAATASPVDAPVIEVDGDERIISEMIISVTPLECDCEASVRPGKFGVRKLSQTGKPEGLIPRLWAKMFGKREADCEACQANEAVVVRVVDEVAEPALSESLTLVSSVSDDKAGEEVVAAAEKAKAPAPPVLEPSRADDFSWIQGRLQWVHVKGGAWVVRYAPLDQEDIHGGSVVLVRDRRFEDFHEGDFVRLEGEILSQKPSVFLGGPLYRVQHITMLASSADEGESR